MALAHNLQECMKTELDLFNLPMYQRSVEKSEYVEIQPLAAITQDGPIEFLIAGTGTEYLDLNSILVYTKVKITLPDGTNIPANAPVGLINYPGATIFSQVDITLGDRLISQGSNTYPYRAYLNAILNYDRDTLESQFSAGLFVKDVGGHMDDNNAHDGANTALCQRAKLTALSSTLDMISSLDWDLGVQEKLLIPNIDLKIRMIRAKSAFCLLRSDAINYKLRLESVSLLVKKVSVAPEIRLAHEHTLQTATAKYNFDRIVIKTYSLPTGTRTSNLENLFLGTLPKRLVIGLLENESYVGGYGRNPFDFKHFNIEYMSLMRDGQPCPGKPFCPDFQNSNAIREYYQTILTTGRHLKNKSILFDRQDYLSGYTFFTFNLSPEEADTQHLSPMRSGSISLETRFRIPLPRTCCLLVYAVYDSLIEVSGRRQVLLDYY